MGSVMRLNAPQSRDIVFNGSSLMTWTYSVTQNVDNTCVLVDADKNGTRVVQRQSKSSECYLHAMGQQ